MCIFLSISAGGGAHKHDILGRLAQNIVVVYVSFNATFSTFRGYVFPKKIGVPIWGCLWGAFRVLSGCLDNEILGRLEQSAGFVVEQFNSTCNTFRGDSLFQKSCAGDLRVPFQCLSSAWRVP